VLTEDVVTQVTDGQVFLRRSELHAVLHEASSAIAPTRFGAHVARVSEDASGAVATLSDGTIERCDLLVLAEGMRSSTRALLWGTEGPVPLGVVYAAASVEAEHGLDERAVHGYFGEGHNVAFVPEGAKRLLIQAYWRDTGVDRPDPANARAAVLAAFQSFGPKVRGLLEKIPVGGDVFCDAVSRIVLPSRVRGRVVLLGDAGYCPTFLSGMGASLGLLGAKVLSLRLPLAPSSRSEVDAALQQYDRAMAPIVAHFQETALANVGTALPSTHLKALLLGWAMHLAPMPLLTRHLRKRFEVEDRLLAGIV
jgi:2-polyprenyl-6-methoxyphenol hydroxylase-like FAD-dependent oxidoreductase